MSHENFLVGAWRLISFEFRRDDGIVTYPFGEEARGSIIYTESNRYSAQLMRRDRPRFAISDQMQGTPDEIEASFKGCISYFGAYELDIENNLITHYVEASLFPNMEGTKQFRLLELIGNRLRLTTPPFKLDGEQAVGILTWERID
jgi:hypothetical protein